jgi:hypothetical protein
LFAHCRLRHPNLFSAGQVRIWTRSRRNCIGNDFIEHCNLDLNVTRKRHGNAGKKPGFMPDANWGANQLAGISCANVFRL